MAGSNKGWDAGNDRLGVHHSCMEDDCADGEAQRGTQLGVANVRVKLSNPVVAKLRELDLGYQGHRLCSVNQHWLHKATEYLGHGRVAMLMAMYQSLALLHSLPIVLVRLRTCLWLQLRTRFNALCLPVDSELSDRNWSGGSILGVCFLGFIFVRN